MEANPDMISRQGSEASRRFDDIHGSTAKEKIQNAYARLRGTSHIETPSMAADSITPSSAGDIEAVAAVPVPHAMLPLSTRTHEISADTTGLPKHHGDAGDLVVIAPSLLFSGQEEVQTISPAAVFEQTEDILPGSLRLGPSEFAVAMSIDSVGKDTYEKILSEHLESTKLFLAGFKAADGSLLSEDDQAKVTTDIRLLIKKLDNITVHTDLNIAEHIKQSDLDITKEATWAEYNSSKFLFLGQLIEIAGAQELHFLFIVGQKETAELLERYFLGKGFAFVRPRAEMRGNIELSFINGSLSVGILLAQQDGTMETYRPPTLIFAIDSSFNASSPMVEHLRTTYARNGNLLPVVHLIVTNSSEHIQRCLSDLPEQQKLRVLVHIVRSLVDILGDLQDEASHVQDNVEEIFTCLMSDDFNANWKLPSIEPLHILVSDEISSGEETEMRGIMDPPSTISKRAYDNLDSDTPDSKRQRLHLSQDLTLMTTQSSAASQSNIDLSAKLQALEARLVEMKADHAAEVERMQKTISDQEAGLQQRVGGWEDLQHRYEARYKELHQIRKERDTLLAEKAKAEEKAVRDKEEIVKLKDERTQLRHELESARNELKAAGGSKEEMETLREKIRELNESNAKLQRANESEKQQSEYLRRKFQEDYSRVAELNGEKDQLQARIDILQSQVDAEAVKLKQLKMKDDEYKHAERVKELEQKLETYEALLRRKDEELRNIRNNRPATRATSTQPRSPKSWGNGSRPTSPGLNINNNNNGVGNRSSGLRFSSEISF